jgi:acetyl esterase/lipase
MLPIPRDPISLCDRPAWGDLGPGGRLRILGLLIALLETCIAPSLTRAAMPAFTLTTVTYKEAGDVKIEADVYRADDQVVRPVVVSIHGGALMMGSRKGIHNKLREFCQNEGWAIVSIDYRLAPEVKLPAIIEDVQDAFRWIGGDGGRQFHLDAKRVAVVGGSAGGYLTMMTGFCVEPRPTVLISYWGFGDIDGEWQTQPSEHYRTAGPLITEDEARKVLGEKVLTGGGGPGSKDRGRFFIYCRQNGIWPNEVMGLDPNRDREKFSPYCPIRNLSADYPPILMIHGTADTDVPFEKSVEMAGALAKRHLPHELILIPNGGHGLGGGDPKLIEEAYSRAFKFMKTHMN